MDAKDKGGEVFLRPEFTTLKYFSTYLHALNFVDEAIDLLMSIVALTRTYNPLLDDYFLKYLIK